MIKSSKELKSFTKYCEKHPELRFWQALSNWNDCSYIYTSMIGIDDDKMLTLLGLEDTYYK